MIELIGTICLVISVIGVLLNNHKLRAGFLVWLFSNLISAALHCYTELYSLMIRDLIFFVLAIHGWKKWGKK